MEFKLSTLLSVAASLALMTGCGDKPPELPKTTPPPPPPPSNTASKDGKAAGTAAPTDPAAPVADAAVEAKKAAEEDAKLQARIKAGEVGTTPDPVMDRNLTALQTAYESFYNAYNRDPKDLGELQRAGYIRYVPQPPAGKKYEIVPQGGGIKLSDAK